jgi:hypothetical protein
MSLTTTAIVLARRRFFNAVAVAGRAPLYAMGIAFFEWLAQQGGRPDMQVVEMAVLTNGNTVIADTACRIYAILFHKGTVTASWFKGTDNATTSSTDGSQDISHRLGSSSTSQRVDDVAAFFYPYGFRCVNGFTVCANTTGTGSSGSAANGPDGIVLLGAA